MSKLPIREILHRTETDILIKNGIIQVVNQCVNVDYQNKLAEIYIYTRLMNAPNILNQLIANKIRCVL